MEGVEFICELFFPPFVHRRTIGELRDKVISQRKREGERESAFLYFENTTVKCICFSDEPEFK